MAAETISLSAASRANLLSLQKTTALIGRTQVHLSSGRRVTSALEDASAFFQAEKLVNRANDFSAAKNGIDQALSTVQAATQAIQSVTSIVEQIKALAETAKLAATAAERSTLGGQAVALATQLTNLINDASHNGVNLLKATPDNLLVNFNETAAVDFTIVGTNLTAAGLGGDISAVTNNWGTVGDINVDVTEYVSALGQLRTAASTLGSNATLLGVRLDFTKAYINNLQEGADKLVLADLNEEGANLLALQTRQQLGVNALSLAAQSEQSVLRLFG